MTFETLPGSTVARLGGDEFAVILLNLETAEDAGQVAQQLSQGVTTRIVIGTHQHEVTASIGMAIYPEDGRTADALSKAADDSMYSVKRKR